MKFCFSNFRGLTLVELLIIIGILAVLISITIPTFYFFKRESELTNSAQKIITTLRIAQNKTLSSEGASQYGVYFNNLTFPHQYILFKGKNYINRQTAFDKIYNLPSSIEIFEINLRGGKEVVFQRVSGHTFQTGNLNLRLINEPTKTRTIYIEKLGQVGLSNPPTPFNGRMIDSRHVHFLYNRTINLNNEILRLTLDNNVVKNIIIAENIKNGQIFWQGEVEVKGEKQRLKIHTHKLNDPNTLFSIRRDRRFNNKSLKITISGDQTGYLIKYSADGLTTTKTSIFASEPIWQ